MSLNYFFAINLPYGIERNEQGEWVAFNREYSPLGYTEKSSLKIEDEIEKTDTPLYCKYEDITEEMLLNLSVNGEKSVRRDEKGEITRVWFYDDNTNPALGSMDVRRKYNEYWRKLEVLAKLRVKTVF